MQQFTYTIKDRDGIHARPAGVIISPDEDIAYVELQNVFAQTI